MRHFKYFQLLSTMLLLAEYGYSQNMIPVYKLKLVKRVPADSFYKSKDSASYAVLLFFRGYTSWLEASSKKVPVFIDENLVCILKNNQIAIDTIRQQGRYVISTGRKDNQAFTLPVKFGETYCLACDVKAGFWFGKPVITWVNYSPKIQILDLTAGN